MGKESVRLPPSPGAARRRPCPPPPTSSWPSSTCASPSPPSPGSAPPSPPRTRPPQRGRPWCCPSYFCAVFLAPTSQKQKGHEAGEGSSQSCCFHYYGTVAIAMVVRWLLCQGKDRASSPALPREGEESLAPVLSILGGRRLSPACGSAVQ